MCEGGPGPVILRLLLERRVHSLRGGRDLGSDTPPCLLDRSDTPPCLLDRADTTPRLFDRSDTCAQPPAVAVDRLCLLDTCLLDTCLLDTCLLDTCLLDTCLLDTCLLDTLLRVCSDTCVQPLTVVAGLWGWPGQASGTGRFRGAEQLG